MTGEAPFTPAPQHHEDRWVSVFKEIESALKEHNLSENATYNDIFYTLNHSCHAEITYHFDYTNT